MALAFAKERRSRIPRAVSAAIEDVRYNPERGGCLTHMLFTYAPDCGSDTELSYHEWPVLLREFWTACEGVTEYMWSLAATLPDHGPIRTMMTSRENAAYDALPKSIVVYRGQDAEPELGICWSQDKEIANWFAMRLTRKEPKVLTAEVDKADILALKLDRNELELITYKARVVKSEPADPEGAKEYFRLRRIREEKRLAAPLRKVRKHLKEIASARDC